MVPLLAVSSGCQFMTVTGALMSTVVLFGEVLTVAPPAVTVGVPLKDCAAAGRDKAEPAMASVATPTSKLRET